MKTSGIYQIRNITNGQIYIGSSVNIKKRIYEHFRILKKRIHFNPKLQNAYNKYGRESFEACAVLCVPNTDDLIEMEQYFLDTKMPEYNIAPVAGARFNFGLKFSKERCEQISKSKKGVLLGHIHSDEFKNKMSIMKMGIGNKMYGQTHTAEATAKIRDASIRRKDLSVTKDALKLGQGWNKGIPFSADARQKMSDAKHKYPILRIDIVTGEIVFYPSMSAAKREGFHIGHIKECCQGIVSQYRGFTWKYTEVENAG